MILTPFLTQINGIRYQIDCFETILSFIGFHFGFQVGKKSDTRVKNILLNKNFE